MNTTKLWRYNTTTGIWNLQRICDTGTAARWLEMFARDEPTAQFKLAKRQPKAGSGQRGQIAGFGWVTAEQVVAALQA
jgi:hypothetical protein